MSEYFPGGPTGGQPYPAGFQSPAAHSAGGLSTLASFAGPIGAGIGGAFDLLGGFLQSKSAKDAAHDAYARQFHWARHGTKAQVEGLKRAGLNPILAAGKIGGASGSQPQAQPVNPTQGAASTAIAAMQLSKLKTEMDLLKAQAIEQQSNTARTVRRNRYIMENMPAADANADVYGNSPPVSGVNWMMQNFPGWSPGQVGPSVKTYKNAWNALQKWNRSTFPQRSQKRGRSRRSN